MNITQRLLSISLLLLSGLACAADTRTALVVGSNDYAAAPLVNSVNDAKAMAAKLKGLGFEVQLLLDANANQLTQSVKDFAEKISRKNDTVALLYFSGHGIQVSDRNILLGTDAKPPSLQDHAIDVQRYLATIKPGKDSTYLVILDACRDYAAAKDAGTLGVLDAPPGTLIALSTSPGRKAQDGEDDDGNGLYTKHLIRHIATPGLQIDSVFNRVRAAVVKESENSSNPQVPWTNSSLMRDLYLVGAPQGMPVSAAPADTPLRAATRTLIQAQEAPVYQLSDFYHALAAIQKVPGVSPEQRAAVNALLEKAYQLRLTDEEMRFIARYQQTLGFFALKVPEFIREAYGLEPGVGGIVAQSDGSGVAEQLGLQDGDIVIEFNGRKLVRGNDFRDLLDVQKLPPGRIVQMKFLRQGQLRSAEAVLERNSPAALIMHLVYEKYRAGDKARVKSLMEGLAKQEDPRALGGMARAYFYDEPEFSGRQYDLAFQLAQRAAALGDGHGESIEAFAYEAGRGVSEDKTQAIRLFQLSAEKGRLWSYGVLAKRYLEGSGIPRDHALAKKYAEEGAFRGDLNSTFVLAKIYAKGHGVKKDVETALRWYERTAEIIRNFDTQTPAGKSMLDVINVDMMMLRKFGWIIG